MSYPAEWQADIDTISEFLIDERPLAKADVIFVFGHYIPDVAVKAARLFLDGIAPVVLITGYWHERVPAGHSSEASFFASIMHDLGVPTDQILLEEKASNTLENVRLGMAKLKNEGHEVKSLVIVGAPWHIRRARATMIKHFPDIEIGTASFEPPAEMLTPPRIARLVGEVDRLVEYNEKGDLYCPEIPQTVAEAVERLRASIESGQSQSES